MTTTEPESKFENAVAERLYTAMLEGDGHELTMGDETWTEILFDEDLAIEVNALLDGEPHGRSCWFTYGLDHSIIAITTGYHGAILYENARGFVTIRLLADTSMELDDAWDEITHLHAAYEEAIA